jgi:uncharacterized RDD family membrane protein YckC
LNWQPYSEIKPSTLRMATPPSAAAPAPATAAPVAAAPEAVCAECGKMFPLEATMPYGGIRVCSGCKPAFLQKLAQGEKVDLAALDYAGFWIRLGAKTIDTLILAFALAPVTAYLLIRGSKNLRPEEFLMLELFLGLANILVSLIYQIIFHGQFGATPGKMACHLRVVMPDGAKIGYGRAAGRFFAEIISGIFCSLGYIITAFDAEKASLHDRICGTRVIHA